METCTGIRLPHRMMRSAAGRKRLLRRNGRLGFRKVPAAELRGILKAESVPRSSIARAPGSRRAAVDKAGERVVGTAEGKGPGKVGDEDDIGGGLVVQRAVRGSLARVFRSDKHALRARLGRSTFYRNRRHEHCHIAPTGRVLPRNKNALKWGG